VRREYSLTVGGRPPEDSSANHANVRGVRRGMRMDVVTGVSACMLSVAPREDLPAGDSLRVFAPPTRRPHKPSRSTSRRAAIRSARPIQIEVAAGGPDDASGDRIRGLDRAVLADRATAGG